MRLQFSKMHGLGNDFMVIDGVNQSVSLSSKQVSEWANRRFGIGFDQLLLVEEAETSEALFKYRIFNADGGEVSQCGNGARCFARFVHDKGLTTERIIPVETNAGMLQLKLVGNTQVEVNMGIPEFEPTNIPFSTSARSKSYQIDIHDQLIEFSALSIGNPHAVIQVNDVSTAPVESLGSILESHDLFPQRVNVGFMQIVSPDEFKLRVFERGVGETMACGSGACAAMASAVSTGLLNNKVTAHLTGGMLQLSWQGEGKPVIMTGDTALVYDGEIDT